MKAASNISGVAAVALSLAMIAAAVLIIFGTKLVLGREDRRRGILMILAGLVLLGNVLILTV